MQHLFSFSLSRYLLTDRERQRFVEGKTMNKASRSKYFFFFKRLLGRHQQCEILSVHSPVLWFDFKVIASVNNSLILSKLCRVICFHLSSNIHFVLCVCEGATGRSGKSPICEIDWGGVWSPVFPVYFMRADLRSTARCIIPCWKTKLHPCCLCCFSSFSPAVSPPALNYSLGGQKNDPERNLIFRTPSQLADCWGLWKIVKGLQNSLCVSFSLQKCRLNSRYCAPAGPTLLKPISRKTVVLRM